MPRWNVESTGSDTACATDRPRSSDRRFGHIAIMLENGIAYLAMAYALKKIDLVEVSINRAFRGPALAGMVNLTGCECC